MTADAPPCERLEWDSQFFGFDIARVRGDTLTAELADRIDAWCHPAGVRCLYFLSRADDPITTQAAEAHAFQLVDIRMVFERQLPNGGLASNNLPNGSIMVRLARPDDLPALQCIARRGYMDTRFHFDTRFPRRLSDALYETWIRRSCEGYAQAVLVAEAAGEPTGYISCHLDGPPITGRIGLVGVSHQAQSQGIGQRLVYRALEWFQSQQAGSVVVATQARNIAAQRLYQRCGFLTQSAQLWYHKWYPPTGHADG